MFQEIARLLSTPLRVKLLKFFLFQQDSSFSAKAVASGVGASLARVERELRALATTKAVTIRGKGSRAAYMANQSYPLLGPLQAFLEVSTLPSDRDLVAAFRSGRSISLVVAAGVLAQEPRGVVDLLIVTSRPRDPSIARAVKRVERLIAIPLRYSILEPRNYDERLETRDRLLRDVFEFKHRVLIGRK